MMIVPHALHCVDSYCFIFTSTDTVWHTVLMSVPQKNQILVLCKTSPTKELKIRVIRFVLKKL